jgi:glycosyltransferase involved in cell wall biosynthesis
MRIGLISTVSAPVRQDAGGSVEAWTWLLARELKRLGHDPVVFGCAGSDVPGELVVTQPGPYGQQGNFDDWHLCEWVNLCCAVEQSARFDLLHTQAYLWGIPLQSLSRAPLLHTLHIVPDANHIRLWATHPESRVAAISRHQWSGCPDLQPAGVVPHGVDIAQFEFRAKPDDYLLYFGRFTSGKGPVPAIRAARALGLRLVLAGPENAYYREMVRPLVDGRAVEYVGPVQGADRSRLLGGARALLYPIQYPEAFGLVLVEAMLCGTPVAAVRLGAVPEIVEDGVTGWMASGVEGLADMVPRCFALDRRRIRQEAERRFSPDRMARDYAALYQRIVSRS